MGPEMSKIHQEICKKYRPTLRALMKDIPDFEKRLKNNNDKLIGNEYPIRIL